MNGSENVYFESLPESYGGHQDAAPYCLLGAYNIMSNIHMINDLGDINQDMFIDIIDAVQLVSIIIEDEDFSDYQYWASDINEDDVINVLDVIEIINNILNMK